MYIESDQPFVPAIAVTAPATISVSHNGSFTITPLDYEAFKRDRAAGTVDFKFYDSRGAVIWLSMKQADVEEAVFGEI